MLEMLTIGAVAGLKKFLKKHCEGDTLAVVDSKLGSIIKEKLDIPCVYRCDNCAILVLQLEYLPGLAAWPHRTPCRR